MSIGLALRSQDRFYDHTTFAYDRKQIATALGNVMRSQTTPNNHTTCLVIVAYTHAHRKRPTLIGQALCSYERAL